MCAVRPRQHPAPGADSVAGSHYRHPDFADVCDTDEGRNDTREATATQNGAEGADAEGTLTGLQFCRRPYWKPKRGIVKLVFL